MTAASPTEAQAEALLVTLVELHNGDLSAAFTALCKTVSVADVQSERYEAALQRAFSSIFGTARPDYPSA